MTERPNILCCYSCMLKKMLMRQLVFLKIKLWIRDLFLSEEWNMKEGEKTPIKYQTN